MHLLIAVQYPNSIQRKAKRRNEHRVQPRTRWCARAGIAEY